MLVAQEFESEMEKKGMKVDGNSEKEMLPQVILIN